MNTKTLSCTAVSPKKWRAGLVAALVSLFASNSAQALPDSFPQYPLQTGFAGTIPPNIMLIMDDSGSMAWPTMPHGVYNGLITYNGNISRMRYIPRPSSNLDNPEIRSYTRNYIYYNPSMTYKPWRTDSMPPAEDRLPPADFRKVSDHVYNLTGEIDLRNQPHAYFYVPKPGIADPGVNRNNYYKYRIAASTAAGSYNGGIVQRCAQLNCTSESQWANAINETPEFVDKTTNTTVRRSQQDELQNIANWFHYHSSRMKMAKAGASEAFGQLDKNYRVGYDRINSNKIEYTIPYANNGGLFEGNNRIKIFDFIQKEGGYYDTPTRSSLIRVGEYYKTLDPYKDGSGNLLSCRKNFTVLTTDGAWNKDGHLDTRWPNLALIAKHYYEKDLRDDLVNNVPSATKPMPDNANWQHMNLFGIAIGLDKGSLKKAPDPSQKWPRNPSPGQKVDDLAYAAGQGRGAFFLANNTDEFAEALLDALSNMGAHDASVSNVASSDSKLDVGTLSFGTSFNSGTWLGDISALHRAKKDEDLEPKWKLSASFSTVNAQFSQRTVLTSYGSSNTARLFDKNTITDTVFGRSDGSAPVSVADNIDYLRGVQNLEEKKGGKLRERTHPLGDIINSTPFYVKDTQTMYVGANDGMLHGINSDNGKVLFSYVPKGINAEGMASLSAPNYEHRFLVDGNIDVSTRAVTQDKNILIAALGRGGRGVFALDVTEPETMGIANVLWDNSTQDTSTDPNMGYVFSRIRIRAGNGNKTWALVPNGIESPSGKAVLFAYELDGDGKIVETHELVAGNQTNNGLMSIGIADIDGDDLIDIVYGGDLQGNLWRWNFRTDTPSEATLLFTAINDYGKEQPITGGITNAKDPKTGELFVGFATGQLISEDDFPGELLSPTQSVYGLIDPINTTSTGNTPLIQRTELQERMVGDTSGGTINGKEVTVRDFEASGTLDLGKKGWYIDLSPNERVISDVQIVTGGTMAFATIIPPNPNESTDCESVLGKGFINMVDLPTGTAPIGVTYSSIAITDGMPTAPATQCDEVSCQLIVCEGEKCNEALTHMPGPTSASAPVKPHRMQWRSLR